YTLVEHADHGFSDAVLLCVVPDNVLLAQLGPVAEIARWQHAGNRCFPGWREGRIEVEDPEAHVGQLRLWINLDRVVQDPRDHRRFAAQISGDTERDLKV